MMQSEIKGPQDYLAVLKRRKWQFSLPALALFTISALGAVLWPPTYRSSAIVLIEEPAVPRDLVQSTVSSYASERVQVITQRVITTNNLVRIMDKYGLYLEERKQTPIGEIVEGMRDDIGLEMIEADVIDPRSGRAGTATIAFNIVFEHRQRETAQRVLNELVTLYLGENLRNRREKAAGTTEFLINESNKYGGLVSDLETKLATFKERHAGSLPDEFPVNLRLLERTDQELLEVRRQMQTAEEGKIYIESQLSQMDPYAPSGVYGDRIPTPAERYQVVQAEFISLSGVYGPEHPDVRRLAREIEALRKEVGSVADVAKLERAQEEILLKLVTARERYSKDHPDIVKLKRQLDGVQTALSEAQEEINGQVERLDALYNPAYVQLATQVEALSAEMRALQEQRAGLRAKLRLFEKRISDSPRVERDYLLLKRDYENALATYREVKAKLTSAEIGEALERERKSERFTLIEPPTLPTRPIKPNRIAILFIGLVLSLGAGVGSAAVFESADKSIHGPMQLAAVMGVRPIVVVGHIRNRAEVQRIWAQRVMVPLGVMCVLGAGLYIVNEFLQPLDVLWFRAERRMDLLLIEMGLN